MIYITIGIPASGKSTSKKRMVAKLARKKRVLWLTPLRAECKRLATDLIRMGLSYDDVKIVPSKPLSCPVLKRASIYDPIIGIALCLVCKRKDGCEYKNFIREAIRSDKGVFIATHSFLWLTMFFDTVVIDEFDYLIMSYARIRSKEEVDTILRAIEKVFGESIARLVKEKYLVETEEGYILSTAFPIRRFYTDNELHIVSATMPNPDSDLFALSLGFSDLDELAEADASGEIKLDLRVLPEPKRMDRFFVDTRYRYWSSSLTRNGHLIVRKAVPRDVAEGKTVTVVARSKTECAMLYEMLSRDLKVLAEGINWSKSNFDDWKRHRVRIIVVRGMFYRSLDIESDVVYAFFQHYRPNEIDRIYSKYPKVFHEYLHEFMEFDQHRAHIQTIFRCARVWGREHVFYLLDAKYRETLRYFHHIA